MGCVYYERDFSNGFEACASFSPQIPYQIGIKHFDMTDIVPLHDTKNLEVLLCDDLSGEIVIGSQHYVLNGKQVFVIPPYTVHASTVHPGDGVMVVLKISPEELSTYINIENYLSIQSIHINQIQHLVPDYREVFPIITQLIRNDSNLMICIGHLLHLLYILSRYTVCEKTALQSQFRNSNLQELIRWTTENFSRKITIEEAAAFTGYNKHHFCCRFKSLTGMTYLQYLTSVRLSHACAMLLNGDSIQEASRACGYENVSYFIQLFKKERNMTPHQYIVQHEKVGQV